MKFAKELDQNAVPEWKAKYLDYKTGKKKLKRVRKAVRYAERNASDRMVASQTSTQHPPGRDPNASRRDTRRSRYPALKQPWDDALAGPDPEEPPVDDRSPLWSTRPSQEDRRPRFTRYGSILGTPSESQHSSADRSGEHDTRAPSLKLPDPALEHELVDSRPGRQPDRGANSARTPESLPEFRSREEQALPHTSSDPDYLHSNRLSAKPSDNGKASSLQRSPSLQRFPSPRLTPQLTRSVTWRQRLGFMDRIISVTGPNRTNSGSLIQDIALGAYRDLNMRQTEFIDFLHHELEKIEQFYEEKEAESINRLDALQDQLHFLRNRRMEELDASQRKQQDSGGSDHADGDEHLADHHHHHYYITEVVASRAEAVVKKARRTHVGKTFEAMRDMGTPQLSTVGSQRDYTTKYKGGISYRSAKGKIKAALIEYYRGLELLKNYALLNRTAFRKIAKKCDKTVPTTVGRDAPGRAFLLQHVNHARFVNSETTDTLMQRTEDYYARYFERGNRKMAISKLRSRGYRTLDFSAECMRIGLFGGTGLMLALLGLIRGLADVASPDPTLSVQAAYLLQIYAGCFLMILLLTCFCAASWLFTRHKVNYRFILELTPRHSLDWRQRCDMAALFFLILGLGMYFNFHWTGDPRMYLYWPVVVIGTWALLMANPAHWYYYRTRRWFLQTAWRLVFSGLYPVEFRDLIFGDFMCSLSYVAGNIELFFCLYSRRWQDPPSCNSGHSRLFGFFTALPGLWRMFQCFRRYYDTRSAFPHLVNAGKYTMTVLSYMSMSLFRLHRTTEHLAVFCVFSVLNAVYCSTWDLVFDWSLGNPHAKHPLLRNDLVFSPRYYYLAMVVDPILRFNWILYVIFAWELQHSSAVSVTVGLSEVLRRGMWAVFRIENEHCANVRLARATARKPLPFIPVDDDVAKRPSAARPSPPSSPPPPHAEAGAAAPPSAAAAAAAGGRRPELESRKSAHNTLSRVGSAVTAAHASDYERKRPKAGSGDRIREDDEAEDDDDDDDEDDD